MHRSKHLTAAALVAAFALAVPRAAAEDNPKRGAEVYRACGACHSLQPGIHLTGPSLAGMWGKKTGTAEGFLRYSQALKSQDIVWDENTLNAWLADPKAMVPGNYMTFRGMHSNRDRGDLIAFLKLAMAAGGTKAVIDKGLISADMTEGQRPEPLGQAGPQQQVTRLRHCRETFFVTTADGTETPHWEMNVRIKIDTSNTGPPAGRPVIVGAGMMGDRVSIVFADVSEIAATLKSTCEG
ncbi:MAG: c-type cytochrome [Hyphomicrobiaceae bacterium]|nr:MAG: c-type cytochrome [Hyphomicrobiaceae bacterium]